jgi:hypothetical protein
MKQSNESSTTDGNIWQAFSIELLQGDSGTTYENFIIIKIHSNKKLWENTERYSSSIFQFDLKGSSQMDVQPLINVWIPSFRGFFQA